MAEQFLSELFSFEREIEERVPSYFDYHSLHVDARGDESFVRFCDAVRTACGSSVLPVHRSEGPLNAVDLAFDARIASLRGAVEPVGEDRLQEIAAELRRQRTVRDARISGMPGSLERTVVANGLTVYAAGAGGTPIILLNAIGQPLDPFFRLIDVLAQRQRVVTFEPRGGIAEQLRDVDAVIEASGATRCILAGWCTGPKVAVEYALQRPESVEALVFLNPTFRRAGTPRELETAYERNSEPLFRAVAANASLARPVMKSLLSSVAAPPVDPDSDDAEASREVAAAMPSAFRPLVARPFRSEQALVEYVRQIVDFWSCDPLSRANGVTAPVLVIGAELDRVASPEMAREVARLFRSARLEMIGDATHYALHERPELIGSMIATFAAEAAQ